MPTESEYSHPAALQTVSPVSPVLHHGSFVTQLDTQVTAPQTDVISHSISKICGSGDATVPKSQLQQMASNPMFQDLRTTLRSECQTAIPSALYDTIAHPLQAPVTVRASQISLRFLKLSSSRVRVHELHSFYVRQSAELESSRFTALSTAAHNAWSTNSLNVQYDQQHHALLDRVEQSLRLVEQREADRLTKKPTVSATSSSAKVGTVAIRIMTSWYERNSEHPYPSYEACEVMAKAGQITVEQVKKWFSNRRQRLGNTKLISQIAARRKRVRTVSGDDILLEGSKMVRLQ